MNPFTRREVPEPEADGADGDPGALPAVRLGDGQGEDRLRDGKIQQRGQRGAGEIGAEVSLEGGAGSAGAAYGHCVKISAQEGMSFALYPDDATYPLARFCHV